MRSHTSPTRRPPQVRYLTIGARRDDAESIRGIARGTGLRIDATVAALVRLYEQADASAKAAAGFPVVGLEEVSRCQGDKVPREIRPSTPGHLDTSAPVCSDTRSSASLSLSLDSSGAVTTIGAAGRGSSALTPQDVDPAPDGRSDNPTSGAAA